MINDSLFHAPALITTYIAGFGFNFTPCSTQFSKFMTVFFIIIYIARVRAIIKFQLHTLQYIIIFSKFMTVYSTG